MRVILTSKKRNVEIQIEENATVQELKRKVHELMKISPERQGLKIIRGDPKNPVRLNDETKSLNDFQVKDDEVVVSDLGPQIGYRTVFVVEYLGPFLIMLIYFLRPSFIYGSEGLDNEYDRRARIAVYLWLIHYGKRLFETFFVHTFSRGTMPIRNIFKNSIYYWGFALAIGYPLCSPLYTPPKCEMCGTICMVGWAICECINAAVHLQFRLMKKKDGDKRHPIPRGPLFMFVSCPNYTAEVCSWIFFSIFTKIAMSYVFTVCGFLQMLQWALQKHKGYIKNYGDEYKKLHRKSIVPFII